MTKGVVQDDASRKDLLVGSTKEATRINAAAESHSFNHLRLTGGFTCFLPENLPAIETIRVQKIDMLGNLDGELYATSLLPTYTLT